MLVKTSIIIPLIDQFVLRSFKYIIIKTMTETSTNGINIECNQLTIESGATVTVKVNVLAPIPGSEYIGVEIPNIVRSPYVFVEFCYYILPVQFIQISFAFR